MPLTEETKRQLLLEQGNDDDITKLLGLLL